MSKLSDAQWRYDNMSPDEDEGCDHNWVKVDEDEISIAWRCTNCNILDVTDLDGNPLKEIV